MELFERKEILQHVGTCIFTVYLGSGNLVRGSLCMSGVNSYPLNLGSSSLEGNTRENISLLPSSSNICALLPGSSFTSNIHVSVKCGKIRQDFVQKKT